MSTVRAGVAVLALPPMGVKGDTRNRSSAAVQKMALRGVHETIIFTTTTTITLGRSIIEENAARLNGTVPHRRGSGAAPGRPDASGLYHAT